MKIKNTTDWPDHFLRRMVSWVCREIGLPARKVRRVNFRNRASWYSGRAYLRSMRIVCSIGWDGFPLPPDSRAGMQNESFADRFECLIAITAHELEHLNQQHERRFSTLRSRRNTEPATRAVEVRVLRSFRQQRETLLAEWSVEPKKNDRPKASIAEKRAAKVEVDLARWQRKLKLAQTKIRKLKTRVRYYERRQAANTNPKDQNHDD